MKTFTSILALVLSVSAVVGAVKVPDGECPAEMAWAL
jgi:hypothetical protein